ncbi:Clavaminate synthase-like protein [Xylaria sp. FL1777]|nr:Clavaminate synthase-like protein [Xylaria sp. FL1777]
MASNRSEPTSGRIATVDLSAFFVTPGRMIDEAGRLQASRALVDAMHDLGFVKLIGHGVLQQEIDEALQWTKTLFDLPYEDKMKAPHPPGPMPHRGYSGIGQEKVHTQEDIEALGTNDDVGKALRKITDFKESYEIGSEHDLVQGNIWLPEGVLPRFRGYMTGLYQRLVGVSRVVLEAIGLGLALDDRARAALMEMASDTNCQLRLLHYPCITKEKLQSELLTRLPPHNDWSTMTLLLQDHHGGLELKDPKSQDFMHATPEEGSFVLNVGDMLQRFTNDYFISALHRVSVPSPDVVPEAGLPARYSVPFFVAPDFSHTISTLPQFVTTESPAKYEPVRFGDYGSIATKYQYQSSEM